MDRIGVDWFGCVDRYAHTLGGNVNGIGAMQSSSTLMILMKLLC